MRNFRNISTSTSSRWSSWSTTGKNIYTDTCSFGVKVGFACRLSYRQIGLWVEGPPQDNTGKLPGVWNWFSFSRSQLFYSIIDQQPAQGSFHHMSCWIMQPLCLHRCLYLYIYNKVSVCVCVCVSSQGGDPVGGHRLDG